MMARPPRRGFGLVPSEFPQPSAGRLPATAILATNWWRRGCWEDCRKVEFADGWVFPFGSNHLSSVVVMSQGEVRTGFSDASEIAALGTKVALAPFDSCFCHEQTPSNSYRFAWGRAYVNRDTNTPMTASIELFRNGGVCVTTNGIPTVAPYPIPFPHIGIGQNDDWVRTNFQNAAEILSIGYANWVDAQVGVGLDNGLYKLTATFPVDPPEATELFVGDLSVCVTNAGEYVFLLEKGVEYSFGTKPFDATVEYSMQDDLLDAPLFASWWDGDGNGEWTVDGGDSLLVCPTLSSPGHVWWMPTFCGSPDVPHLGPDEDSLTFTAVLSDYRYAKGVAYHWTCEDGNVVIASPNSRETQISFTTMPSWASATLAVTATVGTNELCSTLADFTYGTNDTPQVYFGFSVPNAVLLNSNRTDNAKLGRLSLSFSSDDDRRGSLRLSCTSGDDRISLWGTSNRTMGVSLPMTWNADDFPGFEAYVEGIGTSESLDDVQLKAEFIPDEGDTDEIVRNLTVVKVGDVSLPGAPNDGLVVSTGTSVALDLDVLPSGADGLLSAIYKVRRLRGDGSYTDWEYATGSYHGTDAVYNPSSGGIYQVQALAGVGSDAVDERYYVWEEDEIDGFGVRSEGEKKAFGVADQTWQVDVLNCAKGFFADRSYAQNAELSAQYGFSGLPASTWKCNMFVAHRLRQCDLPVAELHSYWWRPLPPLANEWAGETVLPGWVRCSSSDYVQPGWVVSCPSSEGSGHVGFGDFDGAGVAAGRYIVNRAYPGFIDEPCVYRKYVDVED